MKKALVVMMLLSGLVLSGCGGHKSASSNGGNTGGGGGGSQPSPSPVTTFSLKLVDSNQSLHAMSMKTSTFGALPTATDVRVVIRTFGSVTVPTEFCQYDFNGDPIPGTCTIVPVTSYTETYRDIQDNPYTGASVTIGIPVGTGYTLDVITSQLSGTVHNILKYGNVTNVNIVSGQSNSATITMTPLSGILNMTVADSVNSKQTFLVTLNDTLPIDPFYQMTMSFPTTTPTLVTNNTNTCTFTAPTSFTAGTVSLQGKFALDQQFLKIGETQAQWTRLFPLAAYNEQVYSTLNPLILVTLPGI